MGNSNLKIQMDEQIFLARVAEQAERFEDMVNFLKAAIAQKGGEDFTVDERNLLSVGSRTSLAPKEALSRPLVPSNKTPSTPNSLVPSKATRPRSNKSSMTDAWTLFKSSTKNAWDSPPMMSQRPSSPRWSVTTTDTSLSPLRMRPRKRSRTVLLKATPLPNNTLKPSMLATPSDSVLLSTSPFSTTK